MTSSHRMPHTIASLFLYYLEISLGRVIQSISAKWQSLSIYQALKSISTFNHCSITANSLGQLKAWNQAMASYILTELVEATPSSLYILTELVETTPSSLLILTELVETTPSCLYILTELVETTPSSLYILTELVEATPSCLYILTELV